MHEVWKGTRRVIGVITQPQTLTVYAKSQHIQNKLLNGLEYFRKKDEIPNQIHKEETKAQIASDNKDRKKLKHFIKTSIHPLDVESHN